jgi:hypothetical protein
LPFVRPAVFSKSGHEYVRVSGSVSARAGALPSAPSRLGGRKCPAHAVTIEFPLQLSYVRGSTGDAILISRNDLFP